MAEDTNKKKHHQPMPIGKGADRLPLIGGGGLIAMLEGLMPQLLQGPLHPPTDNDHDLDDQGNDHDADEGDALDGCEIYTPFEDLGSSDFDPGDTAVETFKSEFGGPAAVIKIVKVEPKKREAAAGQIAEMIDRLKSVREAERMQMLRSAFAHIAAAKHGKGAQHQVEAVKLLSKLAKDVDTENERLAMVKAKEAVLSGSDEGFDAAGYRVRKAFATKVPIKNIKVAYTSLFTQTGEPYMLCPKAQRQIGKAMPIETSKCRENCIDSRVASNGSVSCAYSSWLLKVADNQRAFNDRLEVHAHPDNKANLMTLAEGERSKPLTDAERNYEQRMEEIRGDGPPEDNLESQLAGAKESALGHHGDDAKRMQDIKIAKKTDKIDAASEDTMGGQIAESHDDEVDPETLEMMLQDAHKGLSEEDIDKVLEVFLAEHHSEE